LHVSMADKVSAAIVAQLKANAGKRRRAEAKLEALRVELAELLTAGIEAGLTITDMAALAGVSRETCYQTLARARRKR